MNTYIHVYMYIYTYIHIYVNTFYLLHCWSFSEKVAISIDNLSAYFDQEYEQKIWSLSSDVMESY